MPIPLLDDLASPNEAERNAALAKARRLSRKDLFVLLDAYTEAYPRSSPARNFDRMPHPVWQRLSEALRAFWKRKRHAGTKEATLPTAPLNSSLASLLSEQDDPDFISPALVVLSHCPPGSGQEATWGRLWQWMAEMLPRLPEGSDHGWTDRQRQALVEPLVLMARLHNQTQQQKAEGSPSRNNDLNMRSLPFPFMSSASETLAAFQAICLSILHVLQQTGGRREWELVHKLANQPLPASTDSRVQEAALACLPFVEARARHQDAQQTYLRASTGCTTPQDRLYPVEPPSTAPPDNAHRP